MNERAVRGAMCSSGDHYHPVIRRRYLLDQTDLVKATATSACHISDWRLSDPGVDSLSDVTVQ